MGARNPTLAALRKRAGRALAFEALAAAAGPGLLILFAYLTAALFGLGNAWVLAASVVAALVLFGNDLRRRERPDAGQIDRRIEAASGLAHRPLAVLQDMPANANPLSLKLWAAHQARAAAAVSEARAGFPDLQTASRDPMALRALLLLLMISGLAIAGPAAPARLAGALALPAWPFAAPIATAWITPPAYAATPPVMLGSAHRITALAGSTLTVIVDGGGNPRIRLGQSALAAAAMGDASYRADTTLTSSTILRIGPWWRRIGVWRLTVVPPAAPVITWQELGIAGPASLRLRWTVQDRYGLTALNAQLAPVGYPGALKLSVPLNPEASGRILDLSDSPYAGLPFGITLTATNLANRTASAAAPRTVFLPGPDLHDKTAIMLAALRQRLALSPNLASWAGADLGLIAGRPPSAISGGADLQIAALGAAMVRRQLGAQDAVDHLTALIHEIEAGPDYLPAKQLAKANAALLQALRQGLANQPVDAAQMQKLLNAMQQALAQHLAALQPPSGKAESGANFDTSALNRLAQQILKDEAAGRTAQAAAELQQLQSALNALQSAQPETPAQEAAAAAAGQAAATLSQLINGEASLLDQTHQGQATPSEQTILQAGLDAARQSLGKAGISLPGLSGAGQSMQNAAGALGQADTEGAEQAESAAIRGLQQAQGALAARRQNSFSIGQGSAGSDQTGANGAPDLQSDPGLGQPVANPAAAIQQEILNEDQNPALPAPAHQYLRRLLTPDP